VIAVAGGGGGAQRGAMPLDPAAALHERLFTFDAHSDTPTAWLMRPEWDFAARHERAADGSQCDLPRMIAGGADAMVFAAYVGQAVRSVEGGDVAHASAVRTLERTRAVVATNAAQCGLALTADDGLRLSAEGRRAIYLSIENAYSLGRDIGRVARFHGLGVRMLGLTHLLNNDVADASTDPRGPEWGGLSPFGRDVVAACNELGIILDASHASDAALRELLARSRAPIVLSHSGPRAVCDHPRNIGDDLLRDLAAAGGVIHINALPITLVNAPGNRQSEAISAALLRYQDRLPTPELRAEIGREYERVDREFPNPPVTLEDFIRHVEHVAEVAGIDHIGIGCDLDGGGGDFAGLRDVADFPNITRALLDRGWSEEDLAKLWGQNALRVMRKVQAARPDGS
jgi:membrane dipeptidase